MMVGVGESGQAPLMCALLSSLGWWLRLTAPYFLAHLFIERLSCGHHIKDRGIVWGAHT
jgi:hypothetical protein